ncbi:MAG: hypothetical protein F9K28_11280 [Bacteroidetes bacterium]|nr:MAG: hypothetical protein F9K28_11280 [Bacteroidota bacterium]
MLLKEILIGFDIREMEYSYQDSWSQDRKETFLIIGNIIKPLSTDRDVWNSIFTMYENLKQNLPSWTNPWENLFEMTSYTDKIWKDHWKPSWIIGITLLSGVNLIAYDHVIPSGLEKNWMFLGYDVSDKYLLSGLTNCGYKPEEISLLKNKWKNHLNKYHLFDDPESATQFTNIANQRVPEHAPFNVYGLYLIEEHL